MGKKLTRNTKVTTSYSKKADLWKFSASMVLPILGGVLFGTITAIIFSLDYVQLAIAILWIPCTWAFVVGNKKPADFWEGFQKPPRFQVRYKRRSKIFRR